jgi:hypothetical protein
MLTRTTFNGVGDWTASEADNLRVSELKGFYDGVGRGNISAWMF